MQHNKAWAWPYKSIAISALQNPTSKRQHKKPDPPKQQAAQKNRSKGNNWSKNMLITYTLLWKTCTNSKICCILASNRPSKLKQNPEHVKQNATAAIALQLCTATIMAKCASIGPHWSKNFNNMHK